MRTEERVLKPKDVKIPGPDNPITIKPARGIVRVPVGSTTIAESQRTSLASTTQHRLARLPDLLALARIAASSLFECVFAFSRNSKAPVQLGALSLKRDGTAYSV